MTNKEIKIRKARVGNYPNLNGIGRHHENFSTNAIWDLVIDDTPVVRIFKSGSFWYFTDDYKTFKVNRSYDTRNEAIEAGKKYIQKKPTFK